MKFIHLKTLEKNNYLPESSLGSIRLNIPPENFSLCMTQFFLESLPIEAIKNKCIIDFGTGSGVLSILSAKLGATHVFATDISENIIEYAKQNSLLNAIEKNKITWLCSNDFNFPKSHHKNVDTILSNPAQIPVIKKIKDYDQGLEGRNMINQLIQKAPNYLKEDGSIFMAHSSLSNPEKTINTMKKQGFNHHIISTKQCLLHKDFCENEQIDYLKNLPNELANTDNDEWAYKTYFIQFSRRTKF